MKSLHLGLHKIYIYMNFSLKSFIYFDVVAVITMLGHKHTEHNQYCRLKKNQ